MAQRSWSPCSASADRARRSRERAVDRGTADTALEKLDEPVVEGVWALGPGGDAADELELVTTDVGYEGITREEVSSWVVAAAIFAWVTVLE